MANIAFIFDGRKKNNKIYFLESEKCFGNNHSLKMFATEFSGHATQLAIQALKEGFTHIICLSGDGMLNEVVNGLMVFTRGINDDLQKTLRLGVLPMGTGNDFIKTVHAPENIEGLKKAIETDSFKKIDVGLVDFYLKSGEEKNRYFINITDIGMGGVVVEKTSRYSARPGLMPNYQRAILSTFFTYKKRLVKVKTDCFDFEGNIMNLVVANGKYFGGGLGIAPGADPTDGHFSVVILGDISVFDYFKNLQKVRKCREITIPGVQYKIAKEIYIESLSEKMPIDMDGEFIGYSPMKVSMIPAALGFLCK